MRSNKKNIDSLRSEGDLNISPRREVWTKEHIDSETQRWLDLDAEYFLHQSLSTPCLNILSHCEGINLEDLQGRSFMDFHGNNVHQVGFANRWVIDAVKKQMEELAFCTRRYTNIPAIKLAEKLAQLAPGKSNKVLFAPAGTTLDYGCYAPAVVFIEVFKRRGLEITMEQARRPMGLKKVDHIRAISQQDEVAALWKQVHGKACTEADVQDMFEKDFVPLQVACIADYSKLIPGTVEVVNKLKNRGIIIGSTSGYFTEAMEINFREAKKQGYVPDVNACASDVPAGRPEPWMVISNMQQARVFPPEAVVKIDDTKPGIAEGLNAGTWTIGLAKTGNEVGLNEKELAALSAEEVKRKVERAADGMAKSGAHYVVESISDVPPVIDEIEQRLKMGDRP